MSQTESSQACRVLFVNRMACLERGGGETFDLEISRHLAQLGVHVTLLSGAPFWSAPPMPLPGAHVLHTPWLKRFPWDKVKGGWRLRHAEFAWFEARAASWIRRHAGHFDIIQICELPGLVVRLKRSGLAAPMVMRLTAPNYYDPRGGVPLADALIASGTSIERLRERGLDHVRNIPNAVDAGRFRPQPSRFREERGIGADEFVALYVARFQAFKNHALLVDAFARVVRGRPASRLVLVGGGPLRERVEKQAADAGLADRVLFLGEVPFEDLPGIFAAADLKVITSDYESFCFAAIEGMSSGLPVLTTDCGWVPRLVADGAGVVVPVGDAEGFARAWLELADRPERRAALGARGREIVLERHTWPRSAEKLLRLYRELLPKGQGGCVRQALGRL